jgi:glycosyltransferase involved in cell wall biosynthesis
MKILLVVPMAPQADGLGAIPKLLHTELLGLAERHEVTVIGTFGELPGQAEAVAALRETGVDARFADRRRSASAARRWAVRLSLASTWLRRRWPFSVVSLTAGVQPLLDRAIGEKRFDVIAVEHSAMSALRYPADVPRVLTEHEASRAAAGRPQRPGRLARAGTAALQEIERRRWLRFQPRAWGSADLVQVFSRGDAAAIAGRAPHLAERIRVNPYGLALPAAADPAGERLGSVLFAGTFTHPPNREAARWLATEIMPAVRERQPRATLRILGSAPPAEIRRLSGDGTEVLADAPSVEPYLQETAVVIAPVRSGGGMRLKVLEALARGKAVVTTPLGAEGFLDLDPEPPLVIAEGTAELAAAVCSLLSDEARRRELGRRARGFAEAHASPAAWAARLEAVYAEARRLDLRPDGQNRRPG